MTKKLVFIASGGRTGTQFLGDLLGQAIENCWSEHEADALYGFDRKSIAHLREYGVWHMVFGRALGLTGIRSAGMRYLSGNETIEQIAPRLRSERDRIYARATESLIVDSYWRWWAFAGVIDQIWPSCKTIGIVRDAKDWIASVRAHHGNTGGLRWTSNFPTGPLTPKAIGDRDWAERWDRLSPVGRLAWQWRTINTRLSDAADADSLRLYRFEDVFDPRSEALDSLVDFARKHVGEEFKRRSFNLHSQQRRNVSIVQKNEWMDWRHSDRALVDEICGELSDRFGYARALTLAKK